MKKLFSLFAILVFLCVLFVGCDMNKQPIVNEPEEVLNPEDSEIEVFLPAFGADYVSGSAKGLIDLLPKGNKFNDNYGDACAVMTYFPLFLSLERVTVSKADLDSIMKGRTVFNVFGYKVSLDGESFVLNEDGIYVKYYVDEEYKGERFTVGSIEYYFDSENQTFSYRQLVMLTLQVGEFHDNAQVMAIEYQDIPVSSFGGYTVGLDEAGFLIDNAFCDRLTITDNGFFYFRRCYPKATFKNGIFCLFLDAESEECYTIGAAQRVLDECKEWLGDNFRPDTLEKARNFDYSKLKEITGQYYKNVVRIFEHDTKYGRGGHYTSHEDFKQSSLRPLKNHHQIEGVRYRWDDYMVFDLKKETTASMTKWYGEEGFGSENASPSFSSNKTFKKCKGFYDHGFGVFYDFDERSYSFDSFVEAHISRIGVKDDTWKSKYREYVHNKLFN